MNKNILKNIIEESVRKQLLEYMEKSFTDHEMSIEITEFCDKILNKINNDLKNGMFTHNDIKIISLIETLNKLKMLASRIR